MDKTCKVQRRKELRDRNNIEVRKAKVITSYVQVKYPDIYAEAIEYYEALLKHYPEKRDLTKTADWKVWKLTEEREKQSKEPATPTPTTVTATNMNNFELRIPLMDINQIPNESTQQEETTETGSVTQEESLGAIVEQTIGADELYPSIFDEISPGLLNELIEELEADPVLNQILQDFEYC